MPLGTQGPIALLGGYSTEALEARGDWQFAAESRLRELMAADEGFQRAANDTEREVLLAQAARRQVRGWILEHAEQLPGLVVQRVVTHWNPYRGSSLVWRLLILAGALVMAWLFRTDQRVTCWLIGLPLLSTFLAAVLYTTGGRFLVPLYGLLFMLAGIGVAGLAELALGKHLPAR